MIIPCDAQTGLDVKRDGESCGSDGFNVFRAQLRVSLLRGKHVPVIFVVFILINRLIVGEYLLKRYRTAHHVDFD
jgi:hypothetical protein